MRQLAPSLRMRRMTLQDLPGVMSLQNAAFTNPWSEEMVKKELGHDWSTVLLAEVQDAGVWQLRGFAVYWLVHDELHVLNVATGANHRRQGIGRALLTSALDFGRAQKCRLATLEVRRANVAAIGLYESLGFRAVGIRPNYYTDDHEDAVVMIMDL